MRLVQVRFGVLELALQLRCHLEVAGLFERILTLAKISAAGICMHPEWGLVIDHLATVAVF